jgi:hypothetical protein
MVVLLRLLTFTVSFCVHGCTITSADVYGQLLSLAKLLRLLLLNLPAPLHGCTITSAHFNSQLLSTAVVLRLLIFTCRLLSMAVLLGPEDCRSPSLPCPLKQYYREERLSGGGGGEEKEGGEVAEEGVIGRGRTIAALW